MTNPPQPQSEQAQKARQRLSDWQIDLLGEWSPDEVKRILTIFESLAHNANNSHLSDLFNGESTSFHHSGREGPVGRTKGSEIYLDDDWTDWTLAHELGHRWNNAWARLPEQRLKESVRAGKFDWLKSRLRRVEKWLTHRLAKFGIQKRLDWRALWYHPGNAPPPCGSDRNFNASEDLAESFAASLLPQDAKIRAETAAKRNYKQSQFWDWGRLFAAYPQTPRGIITLNMLRDLSTRQQHLRQTNHSATQDQPRRT